MNFSGRSVLFVALGCGLTLFPVSRIYSQQTDDPKVKARPAAGQDSGAQDEPDPLKRSRSDEEQFRAQKHLREELHGAFKTWLDQDVTYIISDEEGVQEPGE
jgi:hypothetical protein